MGTKERAVADSELDGLVTQVGVASLPDWVKPDGVREAMSKGTSHTSRGGWGRRVRKEASRNLGDPSRWVLPNEQPECITIARLWRESKGSIVARMRLTPVERRDPAEGVFS